MPPSDPANLHDALTRIAETAKQSFDADFSYVLAINPITEWVIEPNAEHKPKLPDFDYQYLESLAQGYNVPALCFWMKLTGGRLKAFFWSQHGMEARTYSPEEVTDALFHKKAFFFHPAESILNQLEEPMLAAA